VKNLIKNKKGQFVIIAMLMIAIMIISVGAIMHRAVTYYKHEPWEEYLTLMGNIELNSQRLVELSLVNYTQTEANNTYVLGDNLQKWQKNLTRIYLGYGASLNYTLANGTNYNYSFGLARNWNKAASFSAARVNFTLNIASIGLTGYEFMATAFLNLTILSIASNEVNVTVKGEDGVLITSLQKDNFEVSGFTISGFTSHYDREEGLVYTIECDSAVSTPVTVRVWDERGIQVTATGP